MEGQQTKWLLRRVFMISSLWTVCTFPSIFPQYNGLFNACLLYLFTYIPRQTPTTTKHPAQHKLTAYFLHLEKGQPVSLADYSNKVVLVINTASKCGFTPQYKGLEELYQKLKKEYGDEVEFLGFPCNQFGNQEPGSDDDIQSFCQLNYGVSFPIVSLSHSFG